MKIFSTASVLALAGALLTTSIALAQKPQDAWSLVWHDEFEGPAGAAPDSTKWAYDIGDGGSNRGWGNRELQTYSASAGNVFQDGHGNLVIRALKDGSGYTSGRIKTQGKFAFLYGKVEARIQVPPAEEGTWPAFWMLGNGFPKVRWPACGEIDIMERMGKGDDAANRGTLHGPGYPGVGITAKYTQPRGQKLSEAFHVFSLEWAPDRIEFLVDGDSYSTVTPQQMPANSEWVFNGNEFFILLNLAVGGLPSIVGYPNESTSFPQDMRIDYVRVYQRRQ